MNWKDLTMQFVHQGNLVVVQRDPKLVRSLFSIQTLLKTTEIEHTVLLWIIEAGEIESAGEQIDDVMNQQINRILEYAEVFFEKRGLPPSRSVDHGIPLKTGADPVNVRPYRYPF